MAVKINSIAAQNALKSLGTNVKTARIKRRISIESFAERIGVSARTVIRLEKGEAGVSIGTLAMAALVLGEIGLVAEFLDPASDDTGLLLDRGNLPKRIDSTRKKKTPQKNAPDNAPGRSETDEEGVGF